MPFKAGTARPDDLQLAPDFQIVLKIAEFLSWVFVVNRVHPRLKHVVFVPLQLFTAHGVIPLGPRGEVDDAWKHFLK